MLVSNLDLKIAGRVYSVENLTSCDFSNKEKMEEDLKNKNFGSKIEICITSVESYMPMDIQMIMENNLSCTETT